MKRLIWLGAATAVLCGVTMLWQVEPHDEGLMLAWANRIANGQAIYRDFWSNYAPGQPFLLAGLVKLFGPSLLTWRIVSRHRARSVGAPLRRLRVAANPVTNTPAWSV